MTVLCKHIFKAYVTVAYCFANQQNNTEPQRKTKFKMTNDNLGLRWETRSGNSVPLFRRRQVYTWHSQINEMPVRIAVPNQVNVKKRETL